MKIATFNVNSIRSRLMNVISYINKSNPDVLLIQEIKCQEHQFPRLELEDMGYNIAINGQKTYNGVAILSKYPMDDVKMKFSTYEDDPEARFLEAFINGVRVINVYMPNGNPISSPRFEYKISWMERLNQYLQEVIKYDEPLVIGGDYNVALSERELYKPDALKDDAVTQPESRAKMREMFNIGFKDGYRIFYPDNDEAYSYWSYRGGCWPKGFGILLDYFLLSAEAVDIIKDAGIDESVRGQEKASDHAPVWIDLDL